MLGFLNDDIKRMYNVNRCLPSVEFFGVNTSLSVDDISFTVQQLIALPAAIAAPKAVVSAIFARTRIKTNVEKKFVTIGILMTMYPNSIFGVTKMSAYESCQCIFIREKSLFLLSIKI